MLKNADLLSLYEAVCEAAGFVPISPQRIARAQDQVKAWRDAKYDFDLVVIPAIKAVVAESDEPTRTLSRFRDRIAHEHARLKAKPNGVYRPAVSPVLEPPGEDAIFQPLRHALLDRYGAKLYSILFNDVTFEAVEHGDHHPLRVKGAEHHVETIVHGRNSSIVRGIASQHGFDALWKGT